MPAAGGIESLVRRDRAMVAAGLAGITGLSWVYLLHLTAGMEGVSGGMQAMAMAGLRPWSRTDVVLMFVMWVVMMVAMMTPSAAPMILLYAAIARPIAMLSGFMSR